jgi:hypothetical protein
MSGAACPRPQKAPALWPCCRMIFFSARAHSHRVWPLSPPPSLLDSPQHQQLRHPDVVSFYGYNRTVSRPLFETPLCP